MCFGLIKFPLNFTQSIYSLWSGYRSARPKGNLKWVPHPQGWFKANVGGAIFKETNNASIGVVVHDSQWWVLAALSEKVKGEQDANVIEALASYRRAIKFAIEISFSCVIIESDSLSVVKAIQDTAVILDIS